MVILAKIWSSRANVLKYAIEREEDAGNFRVWGVAIALCMFHSITSLYLTFLCIIFLEDSCCSVSISVFSSLWNTIHICTFKSPFILKLQLCEKHNSILEYKWIWKGTTRLYGKIQSLEDKPIWHFKKFPSSQPHFINTVWPISRLQNLIHWIFLPLKKRQPEEC